MNLHARVALAALEKFNQFCAAVHVELLVDMPNMSTNRSRREHELLFNRFCSVARGPQREDLGLARGEAEFLGNRGNSFMVGTGFSALGSQASTSSSPSSTGPNTSALSRSENMKPAITISITMELTQNATIIEGNARAAISPSAMPVCMAHRPTAKIKSAESPRAKTVTAT